MDKPMTKQEQIKADMIAAMKNRDKKRKDTLSFLVAQLKNVEIDKRRPLTDDEVNEVINKQIKQTEDVLSLTPKHRLDIIQENEFTISVLKEYQPIMMDESSIRHEVYVVCDELGIEIYKLTGKDKGKLMGKLMPRVKGKADGKLVNQIVSEYCKR